MHASIRPWSSACTNSIAGSWRSPTVFAPAASAEELSTALDDVARLLDERSARSPTPRLPKPAVWLEVPDAAGLTIDGR